MQAIETTCLRCKEKYLFYFGINTYNVCDECLFKTYLELRGSLDVDHPDTTIIVSLTGEFYTTIGDKEFKL